MENEYIRAKIAELESKIEAEKSGLEMQTKTYLKRIQELEHLKSVVKHIPQGILGMDFTITSYKPHDANIHLNFRGGDLEYASLYDVGFVFPPKPRFNEYNQSFSRDGRLTINDPLNGDIIIGASVGNITKPPSCKLVTTKKRKTVATVVAVCEESGEEL